MVRLVATVGAVGGLVAIMLPGGAVRPDRPDVGVIIGAAGLVLVAGLTFVPRARWVTAALAVAAAVWAGFGLFDDLASGLPGGSTAVLTVAAVAVLLGVGVDTVRPGVLRLPFTAALVLVLAAAAVAGAVFAPRLPVRASQGTAVEPAALGEQPGERRWTWRSPSPVRQVVAAGAGVVVAVDGGELAALDGPTGAVRWRYARPGAHVRALVATPSLATVIAAFAPGGDQVTGAELLVVLDAVTGDVLQESTVDERQADPDFLVPTDLVLPVREDDTVRAVDLRGGADLWTWRPPTGCTSPFFLPRSGNDVVLTSLRCGDQVGVVALDERTGERRWDHMSTSDGEIDLYLDTSPDGRLVSVQLVGAGVVLRTSDGSTVLQDRTTNVDVGPRPLLEDVPDDAIGPEVVDPTTGEVRELPTVTCPNPRANTTTTTAYLRICDEDSLVWQDFATGQVSRTPIGWEPGAPSTMLGSHAYAVIRPAPGAIVVARAADSMVIGYPA